MISELSHYNCLVRNFSSFTVYAHDTMCHGFELPTPGYELQAIIDNQLIKRKSYAQP